MTTVDGWDYAGEPAQPFIGRGEIKALGWTQPGRWTRDADGFWWWQPPGAMSLHRVPTKTVVDFAVAVTSEAQHQLQALHRTLVRPANA